MLVFSRIALIAILIASAGCGLLGEKAKKKKKKSAVITTEQTTSSTTTTETSTISDTSTNNTSVFIMAPTVLSPASGTYLSGEPSIVISGSCQTGTPVYLQGIESTPCENAIYEFTYAKSVDGVYALQIYAADGANNSSTKTAFTWTRDTTNPSSPVVTSPSINPFVSGDSLLSIAGTCETNATVTLTGDDSNSVICTNGVFNFSSSKSVDGTYNYSLTQQDLAGNSSVASTFSWQRDTSVPSTPVISTPLSSPYISNESSILISGSCSGSNTINLTGATAQSMVCSSSSFSFTVTNSVDGSYIYKVSQTNASGFTSASASVTWRRDTAAPVPVTITSPTTSTYSSADDSLIISGACENTATVYMTGGSSANTVCVNGAYSFAVSKTIDGTYSFNLYQVDTALNASTSKTQVWVRDSTIPTTPTISSPTANPYYSTGSSIVISGGCTSGYAVYLGGAAIQTYTCVSNIYSFTVNKSVDASYVFTISQENTTLGTESAQATFTWNRDILAPAAPVIKVPFTSPYTSGGNITISGSCESNATVNLTGDSVQQMVCASSLFSFSVSSAVDGTYNYSVTQTDRAGNVSAADTQVWDRDSNAVPAPTILSPGDNPFIGNVASLSITGNCESGNTVTLGGNVAGTEVSGNSLSTSCIADEYSFIVNKTIDNTYNFTLQQNRAGIDSGLTGLTWTRDTSQPVLTLASAPTNPNYFASATFNYTSNEADVVFECSLDGGAYSVCSMPNIYATVTNGNRTFAVRARDLAGNVSNVAQYPWLQESYNAVALYHFDTGFEFIDSGLYSGAAHNNLTNNGTTAGSTSKFAQSRNFAAASSQSASAASSPSLALLARSMTIEAFVKINTLPTNGSYMTIASKSGTSGQFGWEFKIKRNGNNYYLIFSGSLDGVTTTEKKSSAFALDNVSFNHFAVTWNAGTIAFYHNGVKKSGSILGTAGTSALFSNTAPLMLGASNSGLYLDGILDDVRVSQNVRWISNFTPPVSAYTPD